MCYNSSPCKLPDQCDIREAANTITRKFFEVKTLQEQADGHKSELVLKMSYILSRVLALMKNAAILVKHPRQFDPKFMIFSGHDSTIE
uniref:Uncharacterized protein n=1 Tax=Romanomermis culicivorax TaxID=13658 RepID=A0A915I0X6_ROMCU